MKRPVRAQLSILAGVFGFFAGGLINSGKEIVDIMLGAAVGWGVIFFAVYIFMEYRYKDADEEQTGVLNPKRVVNAKTEKNKGKKIDIIAKSDDLFEDIYKMK